MELLLWRQLGRSCLFLRGIRNTTILEKNVGMTMPYFERTSTQNSDFDCLVKGGALWLRSQMVLILPLWSRTVAIELLLGISSCVLLGNSSCGATALRFLLRLVDPAVEA